MGGNNGTSEQEAEGGKDGKSGSNNGGGKGK